MRIALLVVATACVGTVDPGPGPGPGSDPAAPDAAIAGGGPDGGGAAAPDAAPADCKPLVTTNLSSGQHNAGMDCMDGCHNHGFTAAGTLYDANGKALAGGTITIVDANNKSIDVVSQRNGNFYTSASLAFPITVQASACPTTIPMSATASKGGCNGTGCHTTGAQGPIHL